MRLGQLTRQLNIEANVAVKFLVANGFDIENHPNTKLEDDMIEKLFERFEPVVKVETEMEGMAEIVKTEVVDFPVEVVEEDSTIDVLEEVTEVAIEDASEVAANDNDVEVNDDSTDIEKDFEIVTLTKEEVEKLVEAGEIVSEIEAEAATLDEEGVIKAKFTTLEGLSVKGKIELPHDPRRAKKEEQQKIKEEFLKEQSNVGKTVDGVHPNKKAKAEGEKMKADLLKAEEEALKKIEREKLRAKKAAEKLEKAANKKKPKKKKNKGAQDKVLSPEEIKKKNAREKRQKAKEKANTPPPSRNMWQKIWDFIK